MQYTIRPVSLADTPALLAFATRLFTEAPPGIYQRPVPSLEEELDFIRSHTERPRCLLLAAEADDRIVGLLSLEARQLPQEAHVGAFGISVDADYRGRGVGTSLIEELLRWAPEHGITRIEVEAFAINTRAIALYEHMGFVREGRRESAVVVQGELVDVLCLAKLLVA